MSPYAPWRLRVAAYLIDCGVNVVWCAALIAAYALYLDAVLRTPSAAADPPAAVRNLLLIAAILAVPTLAWTIANRWLRAGRTGQSWGRRVVGITLLGEHTLAPIGAANAFCRDLIHIIDVMPGLGFLWPLWDRRRQTFADMLMRTVVLTHIDNPTAE